MSDNGIEVGQVAMISISDIEIGDRARENMGNLDEIENSMKAQGLISPLAVKQTSNGKYLLLAGERRYTILKKNKVDIIPVRIFSNSISDFEMKSIELAENFYRKDFEYWEYDNIVREVNKLQQQIHGTKLPGPNSKGWSLDDTGKLLDKSKAAVSTAIKRSLARDAFPELFDKCKTQKDASKVLSKMNEVVIKEAIAKKIELNRQDSTFTQISKCYILNNFFDGVKKIPDHVFHLVEIDPPYAIGLKSSKKLSIGSQHAISDYNEVPANAFINGNPESTWLGLNKLLQECYRTMAEHSWLICWFGPEPWFNEVYQAIINAGFMTSRMCGIWTKSLGQSKHPEIYLANSYEMFFYAWKGRPALNKPGRSNIFDFPPIPPPQKIHPTERPVELTTEIYNTFAFPGSRVLIPCAGSGNGIISANELGMSPVGFELNGNYRNSFLVKLHSKYS